MKTSPNFATVAHHLHDAQRELAALTFGKDATNKDLGTKYITLSKLIDTVRPVLLNHGWMTVQGTEDIRDGILVALAVETVLMHTSGEWISTSVTVPLVGGKRKKEDGGGNHAPDARSGGAAVTFGRRYGIVSLLCLAIDDDDDGARASRRKRKLEPVAVQPAGEWTDPGMMPIGPKMGQPMKEMTKEYLRAALSQARTDGKLDAAKIISTELTNRVVPIPATV